MLLIAGGSSCVSQEVACVLDALNGAVFVNAYVSFHAALEAALSQASGSAAYDRFELTWRYFWLRAGRWPLRRKAPASRKGNCRTSRRAPSTCRCVLWCTPRLLYARYIRCSGVTGRDGARVSLPTLSFLGR
jgi:hypothetical protein